MCTANPCQSIDPLLASKATNKRDMRVGVFWLLEGGEVVLFSHTVSVSLLCFHVSGFIHSPSQCFNLSSPFDKDTNPSD